MRSAVCAHHRGVSRGSVAVLLAMLVVSCGGGGGGGGGGAGNASTPVIAGGVMAKGSVILNDSKYDDTNATVFIDDTPKTPADLQDGMIVQLIGEIGANGVSVVGTAQRVDATIEVRGKVSAVHATENPQRFRILEQDIITNEETVYSGLPDFSAITVSTFIEVFGRRDATGRIRATRIEANPAQMGDQTVDEIRGIVSNGVGPNPMMFDLGAQAIDATGAVISPVGAIYENASLVEAHCSLRPCVVGGVFQASLIEVEDEEDSIFLPDENSRVAIEGLVSGFSGYPGTFVINGVPVQTSSVTVLKGGRSSDFGDDVALEVSGRWSGGSINADAVRFEQPVVHVRGIAQGVNTANQSFVVNLPLNIFSGASYSVTIRVDSSTIGSLPASGECVGVTGHRLGRSGSRTLIAKSIGASPCVFFPADDVHIMAPVGFPQGSSWIVRVLGLPVAFSGGSPFGSDIYRDKNNQPISRSEFLEAISPTTINAAGVEIPGTVVAIGINPDPGYPIDTVYPRIYRAQIID